MIPLHDAMNADELALVINHLAREIDRMRGNGTLSVNDVQEVTNALTRVRLLLNDLERVELASHGASREMAERFVSLENRIRLLRDGISDELQGRRTAGGRAPAVPGKDASDG